MGLISRVSSRTYRNQNKIKMEKEILKEGTGNTPKPGDTVIAHYTGTLENGQEFDCSRKRGVPLYFPIGERRVIPCWDQLILKMQVGERAVLTCPPEYAYGSRGAGGVIPPNATLKFDVELVDIKDKKPWYQFW